MKRYCTSAIIVLSVFLVPPWFLSAIQAEETPENELRATEVFTLPFIEIEGIGKTNLRLEHADRWTDDLTDYFYRHNQVSIRVPVPSVEGLDWEMGYRRRGGDVGGQNRYIFDLKWNKEEIFGSDWEMRLRSQWELRDTDGTSDNDYKSRFRVLLMHDLPGLMHHGRHWQIGIGNETFYDLEGGKVDENRLGAGVQIPLSKQSTLRVSAEWQRVDRDQSSWEDNLLLSLIFQYRVPRQKKVAETPIPVEEEESIDKEF